MSKSWVCVKKCPACGGSLVVSFHYSFSRDYTITSKGVLSKRHFRSVESPVDCVTTACFDCGAEWSQDEVMIMDDRVFLAFHRDGEEATRSGKERLP